MNDTSIIQPGIATDLKKICQISLEHMDTLMC